MGWWFGRKSAPADARPFVPAWLTSDSQEEGFARSYSAQFEEVYRRNPVGPARGAAGRGDARRADDRRRTSDARSALVKADGLLEGIAANLLLHGNAYVQLIADEPRCAGRAGASCGRSGSAWSPTSAAGRWPISIAPAGRSSGIERRRRARAAAGRAYQGASSARRSLRDGLPGGGDRRGERAQSREPVEQGAARQCGAAVRGAELRAGGRKRAVGRAVQAAEGGADQRSFRASGNAGRPLLLEGGLKWQALSLTPADMDFVALKEGAARDIALAFGVPPVLVGLPGDATYANAREAGRALYRQTILPMAGRILDALAGDAGRLAGRGEAGGRYRPDQRARRRPGEAVGAGRRGGLPERCGEARHAGVCGPHRLSMRLTTVAGDERGSAAGEPDGAGGGAGRGPGHAARAGRGVEPGGGAAGAGVARAG